MSKTYRREERKKLRKKTSSKRKIRDTYFDHSYTDSNYTNKDSGYDAEDSYSSDYKNYRNYKK